MKTSDFISLPVGSVLKNAECETAARNIMIILARTGDTWRELSWEQYSEHRVKDGHFAPWKEDNFFKKADKGRK